MASRVNWKGDKLLRKADKAQKAGIDATMQAAILHAKANHGPGAHGRQRFESQAGELERSVRVSQSARRQGRFVMGRWGSMGVVYARRIELGFQGKDSLGRVVNSRPYPFLQPAAQAEYPKLKGRIKRAFRRAA